LPTLIVPPFAERLSLRFQPRIVIPAGLFTIGLGFLLMRYGSNAAEAGWLSLLPGSLIAGIGLGLTNTPVTNTTTGSVPGNRAGHGIRHRHECAADYAGDQYCTDGFILLESVRASLQTATSAIWARRNCGAHPS